MNPNTLREYLDKAGFDWETGTIVIQKATPQDWWDEDDGYYESSPIYEWDKFTGKIVKTEDSALSEDLGAWSPLPKFVARDKEFIYFPAQYDGATWVEKVAVDIKRYAGDNPLQGLYPGYS